MKTLCSYLMKVNHMECTNFYVANVSFNTTRENKIFAKIYSSQTTCYKIKKLNTCGSFINKMYTLLILCKIGQVSYFVHFTRLYMSN